MPRSLPVLEARQAELVQTGLYDKSASIYFIASLPFRDHSWHAFLSSVRLIEAPLELSGTGSVMDVET